MANHSQWSESTAVTSRGHETTYSTLEVDHDRYLEHNPKSAPIHVDGDNGLIVRRDDPKLLAESAPTSGKAENDRDVLVDKEAVQPPTERKILGLRRRTFFIVAIIAFVVIVAAAVGGGVGGALAHNSSSSSSSSNRTTYPNTGLAAIQYLDPNGTLEKRVYYQDADLKIRESAWNNASAFHAPWLVSVITDEAAKADTPIAATCGYPHASLNYTLVKNVYFMGPNNKMYERQSPANGSQAWEDDNFTGLYSATNSTYLDAYWNQNIANSSEELVVVFQDQNLGNGLTQARYTSNSTTSNPWVANNFQFALPAGNAFSMSLVSYRSGKHQELYAVDSGRSLQQYEYTISDTNLNPDDIVALTSQQATDVAVDGNALITVMSQDNQPLYGDSNQPECMFDTPLTNLIVYTDAAKTTLFLDAWNCTDGFMNHTSELAPLQKPKTKFLALANMNDRNTSQVGNNALYILYDSGHGPQIEEWAVPQRAGQPWTGGRNVTANFAR